MPLDQRDLPERECATRSRDVSSLAPAVDRPVVDPRSDDGPVEAEARPGAPPEVGAPQNADQEQHAESQRDDEESTRAVRGSVNEELRSEAASGPGPGRLGLIWMQANVVQPSE